VPAGLPGCPEHRARAPPLPAPPDRSVIQEQLVSSGALLARCPVTGDEGWLALRPVHRDEVVLIVAGEERLQKAPIAAIEGVRPRVAGPAARRSPAQGLRPRPPA